MLKDEKVQLRIRDMLRMSGIDRWQIVRTIKGQNVAEHTCNVMLISAEICRRYMGIPEDMYSLRSMTDYQRDRLLMVLLSAMMHDVSEVLFGDLPSPLKRVVPDETQEQLEDMEGAVHPWVVADHKTARFMGDVVKMADMLDAIHFLSFNTVDDHGKKVFSKLDRGLEKHMARIAEYDMELVKVCEGVYRAVRFGEETHLDNLVQENE